MTKSGREIMEIFEAFDLTGTAWSAAQLTGCDAKTIARYVAVRDDRDAVVFLDTGAVVVTRRRIATP
jgi:hypothetical protein